MTSLSRVGDQEDWSSTGSKLGGSPPSWVGALGSTGPRKSVAHG